MRNDSIQGITFDLWNTLIRDVPGNGMVRAKKRIDATTRILSECGVRCTREHVAEVYWDSQQKFETVRTRGLDTDFETQLDDFLDSIRPGLSTSLDPEGKDRVSERHLNAFLEHPPALMPGVLETLSTLTDEGYKIGLICNSGTTPGSLARKFLADIGIAQYLLHLTFSDEERIAKPAPSLFLDTLEAIGAEVGQSAHVGDRPETDILGAQRVGMKAVLIGGASWDHVPVSPDACVATLSELPEALAKL